MEVEKGGRGPSGGYARTSPCGGCEDVEMSVCGGWVVQMKMWVLI